jgi:hypothetical protein
MTYKKGTGFSCAFRVMEKLNQGFAETANSISKTPTTTTPKAIVFLGYPMKLDS